MLCFERTIARAGKSDAESVSVPDWNTDISFVTPEMVQSGMDSQFQPQLDALPEPQRQIWDELRELPPTFVLYGGTAIALQLGHRVSVDFDFFGTASFDSDRLLREMSFLHDAVITQKTPDTLTVRVERSGPVQLSFFAVPGLPQINQPLFCSGNGVNIATLIDLAGTKAAVVQKRAEAKDYIDIDAIIADGRVDLSMALSAAGCIYGQTFNPELTLKALCFFDDGDLSDLPAPTRQRLADAVRNVDLDRLPKIIGRDNSASGTSTQ